MRDPRRRARCGMHVVVAQRASYSQITEEGGDFRDYEQKRRDKKKEDLYTKLERGADFPR